jgi:16S rRNA (guanine966-N2)-methyltransferase
MRVSGGTGRGRRLQMPRGEGVRPTSDKVRQALFNILQDRIEGASFLDLYAGTGAIGIDALSRGANRVVFVDSARSSLDAIRQNVEQSGLGSSALIVFSDAMKFLKKNAEAFDIVFLDPPYAEEQLPILESVSAANAVTPNGIVIAEHFKKQESPEHAGKLVLQREARYGDTVLAFYKTEVRSEK